jgi:hypothetical protein
VSDMSVWVSGREGGGGCCYCPYSSIRILVRDFPWCTIRMMASVLVSDVTVLAVLGSV